MDQREWNELLHRIRAGKTGPDDAVLLERYLDHLLGIAEKAVRVTEIADEQMALASEWKALADDYKAEIKARQVVGLS